MNNNNSLVFRIKLSKKEVQEHLLKLLQVENMINGNEEKYFTEMQITGKNFLMEFVVPMKLVDEPEEKEEK